jgi:hypothetical protein
MCPTASPAKAVFIDIFLLLITTFSAAQVRSSSEPYVVGPDSHLVFMEYEAWFGPNAVTFQGTAAKPFLRSPDMQPVGGGYDSRDPNIIRHHVDWFQSAGLDGAVIEVTNNVSCIFNSLWFIQKYLPYCTQAFREMNQNIRDNTGNLYPAWAGLGTDLKLIPLVGGNDPTVLYPDLDGKTAFEKEVEYFGSRMHQHPELTVIYQGKPLMLIFLGAAQDPNPADNPLWLRINNFIQAHRELRDQYTFRLMAGYLDSQPGLWMNSFPATGPVEIKPMYDFWSWVDRLNATCTEPMCPYFPSYNPTAVSSSCGAGTPAREQCQASSIPRIENLTVSIATAGEYGWSCPNPNAPPYCPDASLRWSSNQTPTDHGTYTTLDNFMTYAQQLQPIFLIVHQFNEYVQPDEGFNAQTIDDSDVTDLWNTTALDAVTQEIQQYRESLR